MTRYNESQILNSELAIQVLHILTEEPSYGSGIARELGKEQSSISRVISGLEAMGFVEKGKRTKAQYYKIDYEGISEYWFEELAGSMEQKYDPGLGEPISKAIKETETPLSVDRFREREEPIKRFFKEYLDIFLSRESQRHHPDTLRQILYLYLTIQILQLEEYQEFLINLQVGLYSYLDLDFTSNHAEEALEKIKERSKT